MTIQTTLLRPMTLLGAFGVILGGCAGESVPADFSDPATTEYAEVTGVDLEAMERRPSGLYLEVVQEGTGDPVQAGDRVRAHYTGWLPDGTEFDSSRGGQPFPLTVGVGAVIPGWDEGLLGMRPGEVRRLVIPPNMAYGSRGAGNVIPPDATLVFEVELVERMPAPAVEGGAGDPEG